MKKILLLLGFLSLSIAIISAQTTPCPVNYTYALEQTEDVCDATGRNQACYGNNTVNITPFSQATEYDFDTPGDMTDVEIIRTLSLSALDEETGDWGITMMRLLANIAPTSAEDVTMLLFGDVEIESAVEFTDTLTVTTNSYANIRRYPNTESLVVSSVTQNTLLTATGRLVDNSWIQLSDSQSNVAGWVYTDLLNDFDIERVKIVDATQPYFAPMQAFYFRSGNNQLDCTSVPTDGLIIQTPEGVGRVTVWINEVTIDFLSNTGTTAYIQTESDETMFVDMIEGDAYVASDQGGYVVVAGSSVTVDLSSDSQSSKVNLPKSSTRQSGDSPLVELLDRPIEPIEPADIEVIATANGLSIVQYNQVVTYGYVITVGNTPSSDSQSSNNSSGQTTGNNNSVDSGNQSCPGNSCNAPGQNKDKDCSGNSCNAPGQNRDKKDRKNNK